MTLLSISNNRLVIDVVEMMTVLIDGLDIDDRCSVSQAVLEV